MSEEVKQERKPYWKRNWYGGCLKNLGFCMEYKGHQRLKSQIYQLIEGKLDSTKAKDVLDEACTIVSEQAYRRGYVQGAWRAISEIASGHSTLAIHDWIYGPLWKWRYQRHKGKMHDPEFINTPKKRANLPNFEWDEQQDQKAYYKSKAQQQVQSDELLSIPLHELQDGEAFECDTVYLICPRHGHHTEVVVEHNKVNEHGKKFTKKTRLGEFAWINIGSDLLHMGFWDDGIIKMEIEDHCMSLSVKEGYMEDILHVGLGRFTGEKKA
jgi:hypothetical protein